MRWKDWSYSRKGGIILILVSIVFSILLAITGITQSVTNTTDMLDIFIVFLFPGLLLMFPLMFSGAIPAWIGIILMIVISLVAWFIIGSLIGWIFGKIESKIGKKD